MGGDHGNAWHSLSLTLQYKELKHSDRSLVFEAVRGDGFLGDVALDDVMLHTGECEKGKQ